MLGLIILALIELDLGRGPIHVRIVVERYQQNYLGRERS